MQGDIARSVRPRNGVRGNARDLRTNPIFPEPQPVIDMRELGEPLTAREHRLQTQILMVSWNRFDPSHSYSMSLPEINQGKTKDVTWIDEATDKYMATFVRINSPTEGWMKISIYSSIAYKDGVLRWKYTDDFYRHCGSNEKAFGPIKLQVLMTLAKAESCVLYKRAALFARRNKNFETLDLDELREILNCHGDHYQITKRLFEKVVNPAIREINSKTAYSVALQKHKQGRKITHVTLHYDRKTADEIEALKLPFDQHEEARQAELPI